MTMKSFRRSLSLVFLAAFALSPAAAAPAAAPDAKAPSKPERVTSVEGITEYRLVNGLRVLLFPDPTKQTITVNITYLVGSRNENYGETGMAHLLEHLMFKGSPGHPNIPQELTSHGARPNGTTWYDRTNYFETFQASEEEIARALKDGFEAKELEEARSGWLQSRQVSRAQDAALRKVRKGPP